MRLRNFYCMNYTLTQIPDRTEKPRQSGLNDGYG